MYTENVTKIRVKKGQAKSEEWSKGSGEWRVSVVCRLSLVVCLLISELHTLHNKLSTSKLKLTWPLTTDTPPTENDDQDQQ